MAGKKQPDKLSRADEDAALAAVNKFVEQKAKGAMLHWLDKPFTGIILREGKKIECLVHAVVCRAGMQPVFYANYRHPDAANDKISKVEAIRAEDIQVKADS